MRILLIGDFSNNFDEGFKNISKHFQHQLSKYHSVETINIKRILSTKTLKVIRNYEPEIIHYFTAPTLSSFILLRLLSFKWQKSKTVISTLHPKSLLFLRKKSLRSVLKFIFVSDLILYQSDFKLFKEITKEAIFFPNGVDLNKFKPVSEDEKIKLRDKYDIDTEKFLILHVGHLSKLRNLEFLTHLQKLDSNFQVLIVGSTYVTSDEKLVTKLQSVGIKLIIGYLEKIEEIYALSDVYVFPVPWGNTINIPLSILEAMACNLQVISLKYPSFSIFEEGEGLYFADDLEQISKKIRELRLIRTITKTRDKVSQSSWENLAERLSEIYNGLVEE